MRKIFIALAFIFFISLSKNIFANEINEKVKLQIDNIDTADIEKITNDELDFSFMDLFINQATGGMTLSPINIMNNILNQIFNDISKNFNLMKGIIIIGLLSSIITNMSNSFKETSVGELAFYICFIAIIITLFDSFNIAYGIANDLIGKIYTISLSSIPLVFGTIALSGSPTYLYTFSPLILFFIDTIIFIVHNFILPSIVLLASIEIINNITTKDVLSSFCKTGKQLVKWSTRSLSIMFISILSLQRITAPVVDGVISKSAKLSVSFVPIVGQVLSEAVDTALYIGDITKNGAITAVIIILILIISVYFIKLISFLILYKIIPVVIEPIGDKRIVKCINSVGDYIGMLISICGLVSFMFIFSLIIAVSV